MKQLTTKEIDLALYQLMQEQPNFVYPNKENDGCFYNQGPQSDPKKCSGCIFGQAFQLLGMDPSSWTPDSQGHITELQADFLSNHRPHYWTVIQTEQDQGTPWGKLTTYLPNYITTK